MSTNKSKLGKGIALALVATLIVSGVPGTEAQAAKKAKLSSKTMSLAVGRSKTIKIKNKAKKAKYKFKSKKASIASVTKKGKVTGKKKGSTKITVTEKKGKKTRKVGVVTVKVTPVRRPEKSSAPIPPCTPAPSTQPASVAPDTQPTAGTETAKPVTEKPTQRPTTAPTGKPTPTPDPYEPSKDGGWMKLNLKDWDGEEGAFLETGNQFILQDVDYVTIPIPKSLTEFYEYCNEEEYENHPVGEQIEILIRGSVSEDSEGFRYWLTNDDKDKDETKEYYTMTTMGHYNSTTGVGVQDPSCVRRGEEDEFAGVDPNGFKTGDFQIQEILTHINKDNYKEGYTNTVASKLMLKAIAHGNTLEGVTITGIWVRYGDAIGTGIESPDIKPTEPETASVETYAIDFDADYKDEGTQYDLKPTLADGVITAEFPANDYKGFQYMLPDTPAINAAEFKYVTITYTNPGSDLLFYLYDGDTDLANPNLAQTSPNKHQITKGLPRAEQETTITYTLTDGGLGASVKSFRGLHVFGYEAGTTLTVKSIVFSKGAP